MGKIVLNKKELKSGLNEIKSDTENVIFNDLLIRYNDLLSQFDSSKGSTANKIREQLKKEKKLLKDLGALLNSINKFMMETCEELDQVDNVIARKIELN